MTDFRYHVVSLVAVFLALAVGVVLGAGPMRDSLVSALTDDVDGLEGQVAEAQAEAAAAEAQTATGRQFADEAAPRLVDGALRGSAVATVEVAAPAAEATGEVRERMVQAGAAVAAQIVIEPAWTDPGQSAFRASLASTMAPNVVGVDADAATGAVLAHALAQALMPGVYPDGADEAELADTDFPDPGSAADRSALLLDLLVDAELVSGGATEPVEAFALIAGAQAASDEDRAADANTFAAMAAVFAQYTPGVVVASGLDAPGDVPSAVLNSPDASASVATVVEGTEPYGAISVPLALAQAAGGSPGHFGPGEGRTLLPPAP